MTDIKELQKTTYVYKGKEVQLTGRLAKNNKASRRISPDDSYIYEIEPVIDVECDITTTIEKEWVSLDALYEVISDTNEKN